MRGYRWFRIGVLLLLLSCGVNAAVPPGALLDRDAIMAARTAVDLKQFPDAEAILLADYEKVAYQCDGTDSKIDDFYYLIVTEKGRDENRTLDFHFNEFYQKPDLLLLEIIKPDGRIVKPEIQCRTVTEPDQLSSNIFDPANKVLQVGVPDLQVGDVLHVIYRCDTIRSRMRGIWCDIAVLQSDCPVLSYRYEISAPEQCPLAAIAVKNEVPGALNITVTKKGDRIAYVWEASQVPQLHPEPGMPPLYLHAMRILVSTAPDWAAVSRWYDELCRKHIEKVSPELVAKSRELAAGAKSEMESIQAIFRFVSTQVRYTGITREDEAPGYEPHDVDLTFRQRYGVCRDKAALLVAMLRAAGLDAYPVLFMAGTPKDAEVPNNYFNHAVAAVKTVDGEYVLMDPTDETTTELLPSYAMNRSYLAATPKGDGLRRTPEVPAEKNLLSIRSTGSVDRENRLHCRSVFGFEGINDNIYRGAFSRWPREYLEQFLASTLKRLVPGAELVRYELRPADIRDLGRKLELELEFSVPDFVNIAWGDGVLKPPFLGGGFGALNFLLGDTGLDERHYPLETTSTAGIVEQFELTLPEFLTVAALPQYRGNAAGPLLTERKVEAEKNQIRGSQSIRLAQSSIVPDDYRKLKNTLRELDAGDRQTVVVKRDFTVGAAQLFPNAQSILEQSSVECTVTASDEYVITTRQRRRVLNYGGVKAFSELNLRFAPSWQQVEFLEGSVTLPDGTVRKVDPASVQVMDLPGNSAAPRYPGEKMMAVSLPGVEPGSVVETAWRSVSRGGAALDRVWELDGNDPALEVGCKLTYPEKLARNLTVNVPEAGFTAVETAAGDGKTLMVTGRNLPMRNLEPGAPPAWCYAPQFGVSAFQYADYAETLAKKFDQLSSGQEQATQLALKLVDGQAEPDAKLRKLRDYVAMNIREAGPALNRMRLAELSPADVTLKEGYGNSADRAILLWAMLKAAGIAATPVPVADLPALPEVTARLEAVPRNVFTAVLLRVTAGEEELYCNDTNQYDVPGATAHDGDLGLDLSSGELIAIASKAECESSIVSGYDIVCAADGTAEVELTETLYGMEYGAAHKRMTQLTPELRRRYFQERAAELAQGAELLDASDDFSGYPGKIVIKVRIPAFAARSGDFLCLTLPDGGAGGLLRSAGARTQPYWQPEGIDREYLYRVELPDNIGSYELAGGDWRWECPGAAGGITARSQVDGNILTAERKVKLAPFFLNAAEYPVIGAAQRLLSAEPSRTILVKVVAK